MLFAEETLYFLSLNLSWSDISSLCWSPEPPLYLVLIRIISAGWNWDIGFDISMQLFSDLYTNERMHHIACTWIHLMDSGILSVAYLRKTRRLCRRCWTETCWQPPAGFWRWPSGWPASRCRRTPAAAPAHLHRC